VQSAETTAELSIDFLPPTKHVSLLSKILRKKKISIETWALDHGFSRSTVFAWKAARKADKPSKGKISGHMIAAIQEAIEHDAKELGILAAPKTLSD
jgi:hypothetical protein